MHDPLQAKNLAGMYVAMPLGIAKTAHDMWKAAHHLMLNSMASVHKEGSVSDS